MWVSFNSSFVLHCSIGCDVNVLMFSVRTEDFTMHANSSSYYCQTRVYRHTTMEEEEALSEFYRQRLYGPHRDKSQERCRSFCTKDSVKDALENGEYDTTPQNKWMPSMKEWYKVC